MNLPLPKPKGWNPAPEKKRYDENGKEIKEVQPVHPPCHGCKPRI